MWPSRPRLCKFRKRLSILIRLRGRMRQFTPTRVGTMAMTVSLSADSSVHPHARGDNQLSRNKGDSGHGSPPRAWGQCRCSNPPTAYRPVHPHARGDNRRSGWPSRSTNGSPPRAWGQCAARHDRRRFRPVHPHARGDNFIHAGKARYVHGSPPRAWGQFY